LALAIGALGVGLPWLGSPAKLAGPSASKDTAIWARSPLFASSDNRREAAELRPEGRPTAIVGGREEDQALALFR